MFKPVQAIVQVIRLKMPIEQQKIPHFCGFLHLCDGMGKIFTVVFNVCGSSSLFLSLDSQKLEAAAI